MAQDVQLVTLREDPSAGAHSHLVEERLLGLRIPAAVETQRGHGIVAIEERANVVCRDQHVREIVACVRFGCEGAALLDGDGGSIVERRDARLQHARVAPRKFAGGGSGAGGEPEAILTLLEAFHELLQSEGCLPGLASPLVDESRQHATIERLGVGGACSTFETGRAHTAVREAA